LHSVASVRRRLSSHRRPVMSRDVSNGLSVDCDSGESSGCLIAVRRTRRSCPIRRVGFTCTHRSVTYWEGQFVVRTSRDGLGEEVKQPYRAQGMLR